MDHALDCHGLYKLQVILRIPLKRTARSYHKRRKLLFNILPRQTSCPLFFIIYLCMLVD